MHPFWPFSPFLLSFLLLLRPILLLVINTRLVQGNEMKFDVPNKFQPKIDCWMSFPSKVRYLNQDFLFCLLTPSPSPSSPSTFVLISCFPRPFSTIPKSHPDLGSVLFKGLTFQDRVADKHNVIVLLCVCRAVFMPLG